jgi:2-polyprenyl-6-methoxyphenol hydroxylase-like FAD-dependent oxidoreductase
MYDALIVGGRCAGAAVAMLLARQGHKVLIIDQATFPSDVKLSTHLVWHAGVDLLAQWGLLDALVATGSPLLRDFSLDMGELVLKGRPPGAKVGAAIAPRRIALDQVLLDAAVAAGAELRQGVSFEDVIREGNQANGRVTGVRGHLSDRTPFTANAHLVIGADGAHSHVARAVGAQAYNEYPKEAGAYNTYAYFSGVKLHGVEFYGRPERMMYAWETNNGQVLAGVMQPGSAPRVHHRNEVEAAFFAELDAMTPELAKRLRGGRRESDWLSAATATFCRQAAGPGWCLVGDAGLTVDPITAAGITNALRDAELLSGLVHEGLRTHSLDSALESYQAQRDAVSVPLLQFAQEMAKLAPPTEDVIKLFMALAGNQPQADRYYGVFGQTVTPGDFFGPANMAQLFAPATH